MGRALGVRLSQENHDVFFGARRREQALHAADLAGSNAKAGSLEDAAELGQVLFWTTREHDPEKVFDQVSDLSEKVIVDLNNRDYGQTRTGAWFEESIAEKLQASFPSSQVVKAFNTIPMEVFDIPKEALEQSGASIFVAGRSTQAREIVGSLAADIGFAAVYVGSNDASLRAVEALGDVIRLMLIDGYHDGSTHLTISKLPKPTMNSIGRR